jgi:hypothetical protein
MTPEPPSLTEAQKALFEAQQGRRLPHAAPLPVTVTATPRPDGIVDPARATKSPSAGDALKADGDFTIFRNQDYGGTIRANTSGATGEPNVVNNGPIVFSTGNWWGAISSNGGQTFSYISPYTMFPASFGGFCCDQTAVYDEARDIFIWTLQYISSGPAGAGQNMFRVAIARPAQAVLGNWFFYDFVSASNTEWDFPGACVSNNFLYYNTNRGAYNSGSVNDAFIFKFPLASLATGAALSYQFLDLGAAGINNLSLRCTTGATDVMYFGAHNSTSQIEVFKWGDSTGTVFRAAVNLSTAWPNATRVCPTPDGRDWCGDDDGRMKAGWIGRGLIGFMWNASAGLGFVNPYVEAARLSDGTPATGVTITPTYVDRPLLFGTGAFQYPGAAPNARGDIGITAYYSDATFDPFGLVGIDDDFHHCCGWDVAYIRASSQGPVTNRWGDYYGVQAFVPNKLGWITPIQTLQGCGVAGCKETRYVVFGRGRDTAGIPVGSPGPGNTTIGVYRPSSNTFFLRNSNTVGAVDLTIPFGAPNDLPVVGDWNGDGVATMGIYRPSTNTFFLSNDNSTIFSSFPFGAPGDLPVTGDWDGNGTTTVGVYRPSTNTFFLRNSNTIGPANLTIPFGAPGDLPVVGDWNGAGKTTIGVYRPSTNTYYLSYSNILANLIIPFGAPGDLPVAGDWNGNGVMTVGVYRPSSSTFFLSNDNTTVFSIVPFGAVGDKPVTGDWDGF